MLRTLRENPDSRRIIVSAWNVLGRVDRHGDLFAGLAEARAELPAM